LTFELCFKIVFLFAGQVEVVNVLLRQCPNIEIDARNNLGFTPLMKAAIQGRTKCAKLLLAAGEESVVYIHFISALESS
jgi:ankyrin repeat protein